MDALEHARLPARAELGQHGHLYRPTREGDSGQRAASVLHSQRDSHATASKRACKVSIGRPFSEQGQALVDSRMNERSWVAAFPDPFECQAFILDCLGVKITTVECKGARQREEAAIPTRLPQTATSRSMTTPEPSSLLAASSDSYIAHPKVPRSRRPAIVQTTPLVDEPFWLPAKVELSERPAHYHEVIFPRFDQKPKVESAGNLLEDDDSDETEVYSNPELNGTFLSALASLEQKVPAKQAQPPQPVRKSGYLDDLWSLMENWQTTHVSIVEDESDEEAELDLL